MQYFKTPLQFYKWLDFHVDKLDFSKSVTCPRFSFFVDGEYYHCPNLILMCEKLNKFLPKEEQLDGRASRAKGKYGLMLIKLKQESPVDSVEPEEAPLITLEADKPDWDKVDASEDKDELEEYARSFGVELHKNAKLENMKKKFKKEYVA